MVNHKSKPVVVSGRRIRKMVTVPDQSMSIQEIVRRFVRGIPADVKQRQEVYIDQSEHDLEKLNRMDFSEKAEFAEALEQRNVDAIGAIKARERAQRESEQRERQEQSQGAAKGSGIGPLDNTMPVDTKQTAK